MSSSMVGILFKTSYIYIHTPVFIIPITTWLSGPGRAGKGDLWQDAEMKKPFAICISGPSRAGKTTLAEWLCKRLCGAEAKREPRKDKRDKVRRFVGNGIRVAVMCQDSYFLASVHQNANAQWDCPASLNHDRIYAALKDEIRDPALHCLIFEGFKAFYDERVPELMDMLLWFDVCVGKVI